VGEIECAGVSGSLKTKMPNEIKVKNKERFFAVWHCLGNLLRQFFKINTSLCRKQ
jgi:hypothetical protein